MLLKLYPFLIIEAIIFFSASARSHTADEFIRLEEIEKGIALYVKLLENLANTIILDHKI